MAMDELLRCYNKGCGKQFRLEENSESSCIYHPGAPVFHDALKGWSCCKKRVSDFTECLNLKGCTTGWHNNVKPAEPEKKGKTTNSKEPMYQLEVKPTHRQPTSKPAARPPDNEPMIDLKTTVMSSLKQQLEKLSLNNDSNTGDSSSSEGGVKIGTSCTNKGCRATYEGPHSNTEKCVYHPGVPIFHEGMKYWSCCQRKTSDFDAFLNQEGCEIGNHNWTKPKVAEEKKVRFDWHQTSTTVCMSIFAKVAIPDKAQVKANRVKCDVSLVYEGGSSMYNKTFVLREAIDPAKSDVKLLGSKVEINLKKAESFSWPTVELPDESKAVNGASS